MDEQPEDTKGGERGEHGNGVDGFIVFTPKQSIARIINLLQRNARGRVDAGS